jgi:polysaccharide biosynthesis/export protein
MCVTYKRRVCFALSESLRDSPRVRPMNKLCAFATTLLSLLFVARAGGQIQSERASNQSNPKCEAQPRSTYLLGPDDQLEISGSELIESGNKPSRIDGEGDVNVPLVGSVHVAGLTSRQAEEKLNGFLRKYIRDPQVAVNVVEVHSEPVSVLGAVNTPGVHQVQGHKTLLEMLALAGGVRPDAGYSIHITRQLEWGCLPLPGAQVDPTGGFSVAEVNLKAIMQAKDPEDNIQILPNDVISVPKAETVYVIGDVKRSGGFALDERRSVSVLQALSLAEGLTGTADTHHAKILRLKEGADQREELPVDLKEVLKGKQPDLPMQADDILFVPGSTGKKAALRGLEAALQTGTGLVIWRTP